MTLVRFLILLAVADAAFIVWLGWWLSRTPRKPRRGGYIGDRWQR